MIKLGSYNDTWHRADLGFKGLKGPLESKVRVGPSEFLYYFEERWFNMHSLPLSLYRTRTSHNHEIQMQHKIVKILSNLFHF